MTPDEIAHEIRCGLCHTVAAAQAKTRARVRVVNLCVYLFVGGFFFTWAALIAGGLT